MNRTDFFEKLYQFCEGRLELRAFTTGQENCRKFIAVGDFLGIERFCSQHQQYNIYFGVGTRDDSGSGCKQNVLEIPSLWADVDFKDIKPADVKTQLDRFTLRPSAAVLTGHGVHFYWILKEPATCQDFNTVEDLLRRICAQMTADPSACEIARVLRIPGTVNVKYDPVPVKIHWFEDYCYELDDFDFLPEAPATIKRSNGKSINPPGWMVEAFKGVPEGGNDHFAGRDVAAVKIAGYFINSLSASKTMYLLQCWNIRNNPPLSNGDLKKTINSVKRYRMKNNRGADEFKINLQFG